MKMLVFLLVLSLLFLASCGTSKNTQQTPDNLVRQLLLHQMIIKQLRKMKLPI